MVTQLTEQLPPAPPSTAHKASEPRDAKTPNTSSEKELLATEKARMLRLLQALLSARKINSSDFATLSNEISTAPTIAALYSYVLSDARAEEAETAQEQESTTPSKPSSSRPWSPSERLKVAALLEMITDEDDAINKDLSRAAKNYILTKSLERIEGDPEQKIEVEHFQKTTSPEQLEKLKETVKQNKKNFKEFYKNDPRFSDEQRKAIEEAHERMRGGDRSQLRILVRSFENDPNKPAEEFVRAVQNIAEENQSFIHEQKEKGYPHLDSALQEALKHQYPKGNGVDFDAFSYKDLKNKSAEIADAYEAAKMVDAQGNETFDFSKLSQEQKLLIARHQLHDMSSHTADFKELMQLQLQKNPQFQALLQDPQFLEKDSKKQAEFLAEKGLITHSLKDETTASLDALKEYFPNTTLSEAITSVLTDKKTQEKITQKITTSLNEVLDFYNDAKKDAKETEFRLALEKNPKLLRQINADPTLRKMLDSNGDKKVTQWEASSRLVELNFTAENLKNGIDTIAARAAEFLKIAQEKADKNHMSIASSIVTSPTNAPALPSNQSVAPNPSSSLNLQDLLKTPQTPQTPQTPTEPTVTRFASAR